MNDISSREEEFFARFERFKARMRELRGLRVNQFLGLLDRNQQRKVQLIEKEVEEFVRKFAYGGGLSPLLQESILVAFNSDQVMRKRIELQSQGKTTGPGVATTRTRAVQRNAGDKHPPGTASVGRGPVAAADKSTGFFRPTTEEITRQARQLMGGKRITDRSLNTLRQAITRKLESNGNSRVKLALTAAGKVSILVDE